jgi:redox-sensitive bicupin YhaK (pirin superfamily)
MSAGKGVFHSEYNHGDQTVRLLQIWVLPDQLGYEPNYGDYRFKWDDRVNKWLHLVGEDAPVNVHQDVNFYVTYLEAGQSLDFEVTQGRQAYVVEIENDVYVNDMLLKERDALEVVEEPLTFKSEKGSHLLIIEMKKSS